MLQSPARRTRLAGSAPSTTRPKGFNVKTIHFSLAVLAVASFAAFAVPAMAANTTITVNTHVDASHIGQLALDASVAGDQATASATNIVGLNSVTGAYLGNLDLRSTAEVDHVIQISGAGAGGTNPGSVAEATAENVAGLVDDTLTGVTAPSDIVASVSADHVLQAGLAVAVANHVATSSMTNFTAGVVVNINQ